MEKNVAKIIDNDTKNLNIETMKTLLNDNWKDVLGQKQCLTLKPPESVLKRLLDHDLIDIENDNYSIFTEQYGKAARFFDFSKCRTEEDCSIKYNYLVHETVASYFGRVDPYQVNYAISRGHTQSSTDDSQSNYNKLFTSFQEENEIKNSHKRPDFLSMDRFSRVLIRGEEKLHSEHLKLAKNEIESKNFQTNLQQYSSIKYSFGYAAANNLFQLFIIDNDNSICGEKNLICYYNLICEIERFKLITNMICIAHICYLQSENNRTAMFHPLFVEFSKSDNSRTYQYCCGNTILKKVKLSNAFFGGESKKIEYLDNLKTFYLSSNFLIKLT